MALFGHWWRLPSFLGLLSIARFRGRYRKERLHDTGKLPSTGEAELPPKPPDGQRSADGSYNDLSQPQMGRVWTRFGRNFPLETAIPDPPEKVLQPSPREVSLRLMTRQRFQPATSLNLLAASWIQFQVHDWFSHGKNQKEDPWVIPLEDGDPWPEKPMRIRRTGLDPTRPPDSGDGPPTFLNRESHWWDGSQIYGSSIEVQNRVRAHEDGKLALTAEDLLPLDPETGVDFTGVNGNWWVGLSMLHTLFTLEHNAICEALRKERPDWNDETLFHKARLVNAALMAKIHTLDWTPGILAHPTTQRGMAGTWYGLRGEKRFREKGRAKGSELWAGIPGGKQEHHAAPYAMTEEFVSVYRMHPLMPDELVFHQSTDHGELESMTLPEASERRARALMEGHSLTDLFYSFGVSHPGAITLHNYPRFMQKLERENSPTVDLAAVDILRDRERGIPRYNEFRRLVFKDPVKKFEKLSDNPEWVEELRSVYDNDIEQVDLMAGLYAEEMPKGFGFSETAFRIFSVMAPRRLKSDRFITDFYNPSVYTQTGIDWVENNNFRSVLLRHMPGLAAALSEEKNPFAPWRRAQD